MLRYQLGKKIGKVIGSLGIIILSILISKLLITTFIFDKGISDIVLSIILVIFNIGYFRWLYRTLIQSYQSNGDTLTQLGYTHSYETFISNVEIHRKIRQVGKKQYLDNIMHIIKIRNRDVRMFDQFISFLEIYCCIVILLILIDPIEQWKNYYGWIIFGLFGIIFGLYGFNYYRDYHTTQLLGLAKLIDHYHDDD